MRIGIISDTHDQVDRTARAVSLLAAEGAEALIHCGDLTGPAVVAACGLLPGYFVFGNNDFNEAALRVAMADIGAICLGRAGEIALGGRRIAVTHGDSALEFRRLAAGRRIICSPATRTPPATSARGRPAGSIPAPCTAPRNGPSPCWTWRPTASGCWMSADGRPGMSSRGRRRRWERGNPPQSVPNPRLPSFPRSRRPEGGVTRDCLRAPAS